MQLKREDLVADLDLLREQERQADAAHHAVLGAIRMLELLIARWDTPEPEQGEEDPDA